MTIAATQTFNNGQYGHSIATRGPGTEAKAAIESKIAGYRAALADVQPLTNRRTKFVVLAFESSGWTDPTVQKLVNVWEQQASRRTPVGAQHQTRAVQRDPILELGFPHGRGPFGVRVPVPG